MENYKLLRPYDKEYMKTAMLKHEETFRQQVYELHRLYRIQKMLMKDSAPGKPNRQRSSNDHSQDYTAGSDSRRGVAAEIEDDAEVELTLGPTSYYRRRKAAATPRNSGSGHSFSSSTGSSIRASSGSYVRREEQGFPNDPWLFHALNMNIT